MVRVICINLQIFDILINFKNISFARNHIFVLDDLNKIINIIFFHGLRSVIFQRKMEETMEIDFQRRIWLSNQWDVDCVTIQAKWRLGDMVEMFRNGEWVPAVVHSCSAENNIAWLLLQTNAKSETHHKLPRFGNHVVTQTDTADIFYVSGY